MMQYVKDGILFRCDMDIDETEADNYIERAKERGFGVIDAHVVGDDIELKYSNEPFERIRRITGYLVGTLDRFNDAKRSEVGDRVHHSLGR